uniref:Ubiquitin like modifier activating enzyme 7 n=1 Tax=Podarcis muralis TaxID=64176 RepID=A0A670HTV9_PODMU
MTKIIKKKCMLPYFLIPTGGDMLVIQPLLYSIHSNTISPGPNPPLSSSFVQCYVLGYEAMQKIVGAAVLVSGMKGLGVEIAKNVILAGVKSVTVHDQSETQWSDLSSQFYLSENDVGKNRALVSQCHLAELNAHVPVYAYTNELSESFLSTFQVVVLSNSPLEEQLRISDFCHSKNICFVLVDTKGLAGQLFCDFGEHFIVRNPSEAEPASAAIHHITQSNPGIVTVACDNEERQGHRFEDGDWVKFSGVEGMTELNTSEPCLIRLKGTCSLEVGDTSSFSPYKCGGIITQVKIPQKHSYPPQIDSFLIFTPQQADADKMVELAQTISVSKEEELQEDLVRTFSYGCSGDLSPINAFIGGLAAQEVLKAASGKFTPLDQWLYFDAYECLPEEENTVQLTEEDCAPRGSRYDGQIAVFGNTFQEWLGKQKYFVVGAGAIGCELLKNFAMIGLAASEGGSITVTDMDTIEYSNLNRQFLFRPGDVSKQKSEVAAAAVKLMNRHINVSAQQNQVGPDTEHFYGDDFFLGLDGVASALDSLQARKYLCQRCVQYCKPLLDSGTEGTRGHVQVFVPFLTESFGQAQEEEETQYPLCTLRHFPSTIQHTLQWARDQFEGLFKTKAENVNTFLKDPSFLESQEMEAVKMLESVRISFQEKPCNWRDCVVWARRLWERLFSHDIQQLLHNFPPEHETSSGLPFWSGPKRCPQPLKFDSSHTTHKTFILAASHLFASTHKLRVSEDDSVTSQVLFGSHLPPFQPLQGVHIPLTDQEMQNPQDSVGKRFAEGQVFQPSQPDPSREPGNDIHLNFVMTAANLRAENYGIPPADKLQIVGRIVPAIATTTTAVAGLVCLELYKLVWRHRRLSSYRNSFLQLSEPLLNRFQPLSSRPIYKVRPGLWAHHALKVERSSVGPAFPSRLAGRAGRRETLCAFRWAAVLYT